MLQEILAKTFSVTKYWVMHSTLNPLLTISLVKIKATFPWYMRLHMLMGTSPVVDRSTLAHSTMGVGLNMLE